MKRILSTFIYGLFAVSAAAQQSQAPAQNVLHIATALNHLTVLEFHEPVTMAAAGSSDFQIERQDNKVFVKPTKPGVSTDLLVWTASRRFAYELETTEEVKTMNFAIDAAIPARAAGCKHQRGRTRRHDVDARVPGSSPDSLQRADTTE